MVWNLTNASNAYFMSRILRGELTPAQLARMAVPDMGPKELIDERRERSKKMADGYATEALATAQAQSRFVQKSKKGERIIEEERGELDVETPSVDRRKIELPGRDGPGKCVYCFDGGGCLVLVVPSCGTVPGTLSVLLICLFSIVC